MKRLMCILTLVLAFCATSYASDWEGIWMAQTPFGAAFISMHEHQGTVVGIWLDPRWEWEAAVGSVGEGGTTASFSTVLSESSEVTISAELLSPDSMRAIQVSCTPKPEGTCDFPDGMTMDLTKVFGGE